MPVRVRENWLTIARQREPAAAIQPVRQAMQQDRVEAGIAQHDLQHAARGGIALEHGVDLFADGAEHECSSAVAIISQRLE